MYIPVSVWYTYMSLSMAQTNQISRLLLFLLVLRAEYIPYHTKTYGFDCGVLDAPGLTAGGQSDIKACPAHNERRHDIVHGWGGGLKKEQLQYVD